MRSMAVHGGLCPEGAGVCLRRPVKVSARRARRRHSADSVAALDCGLRPVGAGRVRCRVGQRVPLPFRQ